jgi:hypothetical protein
MQPASDDKTGARIPKSEGKKSFKAPRRLDTSSAEAMTKGTPDTYKEAQVSINQPDEGTLYTVCGTLERTAKMTGFFLLCVFCLVTVLIYVICPHLGGKISTYSTSESTETSVPLETRIQCNSYAGN